MLCKHNAWVLHHNRQVQSLTCWNVFSVADGRLWIWCKHHTCASNGLRSNFMGHTLPLHCKVLLCACGRADIGIHLVPLPWRYIPRLFPFSDLIKEMWVGFGTSVLPVIQSNCGMKIIKIGITMLVTSSTLLTNFSNYSLQKDLYWYSIRFLVTLTQLQYAPLFFFFKKKRKNSNHISKVMTLAFLSGVKACWQVFLKPHQLLAFHPGVASWMIVCSQGNHSICAAIWWNSELHYLMSSIT